MFEYDEETKMRTLTTWGFDITNLDIKRIEHVPMHQYRVATSEHPMLYVDNLQCCIGVYAYGKNFSFAAHINPVVIRGDDYEFDESGNVFKCRRIDDLREAILEKSLLSSIVIGTTIGYSSLDDNYPTVKIIYTALSNLTLELISKGIDVKFIPKKYAPEFILDTESNTIILPKKIKKLQKTN